MKNNRIEALLGMLNTSPSDPFLRYALGTEFLALGNNEMAKSYFEELVQEHPDYVATYYHYAKLLWTEKQTEAAIAMARKGIDLAQEKGERHALNELNMLVEEWEE